MFSKKSNSKVQVSLEFTPNPNTLKYMVNLQILERGGANFRNMEEARKGSPLAVKLFETQAVSGVMVGRNFITVTKTEDADWEQVHETCSTIIEDYFTSGQQVLTAAALQKAVTPSSSPVEAKIIEILDNEIRPAVAMDGGDIVFERYEDGIVYLHLQGACAGCPGATMTLKMGVENRLREALPEVKEVVSV